ncbi:serine hydrolase [Prosthecobacter vanneervenii]|uniref:Beta-lactamase n=1 Tax=Prosthecobacter vanneervenii TaxID=48466 RepID=A0A7W7YF26_9BACT|nr:serine hydrolase [Prosthecobacter vanneervenii]MBB5034899.1 CubicO group peptidase (beta-lactamase class C family) [Prosthecobacter vanneervenii]
MKNLFRMLSGLLIAAHSAHAGALAEAAARKAKLLPSGCIVTGERLGDQVSYAMVGQAPETGDTKPEKIVFEIGSISKVFTGLLLAQAVVDKKVTLETTIGSLLEEKVKFADPRVAAITLKQLATHTSGLPCLPDNAIAGAVEEDPYANYDEKLLWNYLATARLDGESPFSFSYSNLGVGLLGHLLGGLYQKSWDKVVVEKICQPLVMKDTALYPESKQRLATPHDGGKEAKPWHMDALAGCGALRSTAADLMTFGEALLHPDQTPLKEAFTLALRPQADAASMGGQIGLGVLLGKFDGDATLHHDGGTGGFCSGLQVIPAKGIVRVVLINNNTLAGSEVIAGTSTVKPVDPATQKEITLSAEMMKQFPGLYDLDRDSRFIVKLQDGRLFVKLTGQVFLRLFAKAPDRFFMKEVAAEVAFNRREGVIHSLTLFQNGNEITAKVSATPPPDYKLRSAKALQPYAGEYSLMGLRKVTICVRGYTLFAKLEGQPELPVFETMPDRFEYDVVAAALVFTRDDDKQINGLTLFQNGMTMPAPRVKTPSSAPKQ